MLKKQLEERIECLEDELKKSREISYHRKEKIRALTSAIQTVFNHSLVVPVLECPDAGLTKGSFWATLRKLEELINA